MAAARLEGTIQRWIGLSTEQKPGPSVAAHTDSTGKLVAFRAAVPPGSSFLETDTGRIARYDGDQWVYQVPEEEVALKLEALIELQRQTNETLLLMLSKL